MDDPAWITQLIIVFIALALSAFFSGMEIAFITANKLKIELDKKKDILSANILSSFLDKPKRFIAAMLVGNNVALVTYSYFAGELLMNLGINLHETYGYFWLSYFVPEHSPYFALFVQTIITTVLVLFGGEFIPKALFQSNPNWWLSRFAIPLKVLYILLWPLATLVTWISKKFIRLMTKNNGKSEDEKLTFGKIDLGEYLKGAELNEENKEFENEIQILQNALEFSDVKARDCMVPRNEICAVDIEDTVEELTQLFIETGYSKIIIYRESIDNIIGYTHSHELLTKPPMIQNVILPIAIVPEPMPAYDILELLIQQKKNMAVVLDEFGGTAGILTIEDIVEEIFGEIADEHDSEDLIEEVISDREYRFSARHEVYYINQTYHLDLPESEDVDTISGLIILYTESIPPVDEVITIGTYEFTILEVSDTKIEEVRLRILEEEIENGESDS